jgi:ketosteroid isomerase-like protein
VSALLKNLGGKVGARAPSTITFTMADSASKKTIGTCQVQVQPDVGYNATTRVSCTINLGSGQQANAALITATPDNPGRA